MTTESMPPLPEPEAWRVRLRSAPNYWIAFLHKPADALKDPEREVQPLITPEQVRAYAQAYAAQEVAKERDCRTCVNFSGFTCSAALRCIDGSSYRALVPIQAWERSVPNPGF